MNNLIKVIKHVADQAADDTIQSGDASIRRQAERDLRESVNSWIEERRRNEKIETGVAFAQLRQLFA